MGEVLAQLSDLIFLHGAQIGHPLIGMATLSVDVAASGITLGRDHSQLASQLCGLVSTGVKLLADALSQRLGPLCPLGFAIGSGLGRGSSPGGFLACCGGLLERGLHVIDPRGRHGELIPQPGDLSVGLKMGLGSLVAGRLKIS